ncbi:MAG: isoprenyl transferase [Defluviitaleaceae bacterium]|nr:isoprenyl transferase [Defluviitaleaceae bacterium]
MKNKLNLEKIPEHIAIIMDGNGRWAKKRLLPHSAGHRSGANTLKTLSEEAEKLGVKYLTVYAFSTENWNRSKEEVSAIMKLLEEYIEQYIKDTKKNNMRIKVIGKPDGLSETLIEKIKYLEDYTKDKTGLTMVIAFNYGGRDEILRAVNKVLYQAQKGAITDVVDENTFMRYLDTKEIPDPDLLIRTSGEKRLSNFLLWQTAYSEFYFSDKLWPDFNIDDLKEAILAYQARDRRFGKR